LSQIIGVILLTLFRVAFITFSDQPSLIFDFAGRNTSRSRQMGIRRAPFTGGSAYTSRALALASSLLLDSASGFRGGNVAVIYATNDVSQDAPEDLETQVDILRSLPGVEIFALALGDQVSIPELTSIVSEPLDRHIFRAQSFQALNAEFALGSLSSICAPPPVTTSTTTTTLFSCASSDFVLLIGASESMDVFMWQRLLNFFADISDVVSARSRFGHLSPF
jgi:hypothetical protein